MSTNYTSPVILDSTGQDIIDAINRLAAIPYSGGGFDYSTDEQQVGTWINSELLYQKTFSIGALPNSTTKDTAVGYASGAINIIDIKGFAVRSSDNMHITLPRSSTTLTDNIDVNIISQDSNLYIRIVDGDDYSSFNGYITIQYTKVSS